MQNFDAYKMKDISTRNDSRKTDIEGKYSLSFSQVVDNQLTLRIMRKKRYFKTEYN
jgi:hypothetical protein